MSLEIPVKLHPENAKVPTKGSPGAAGYDLYACQSYRLFDGAMGVIHTGVSMAIPPGWYGRVAPRSGLAFNHQIDVFAGVIDSDYRGEIMVLLKKHSTSELGYLDIKTGDRIAQLIIEKCADANMTVVDDPAGLDASTRGAEGFGSTGL